MVCKTSSIFSLHLPPSRCRPINNAFKAIPFGLATRLKRNCLEEIFPPERTAAKGYIVNQGYPSKLFNDQFSKTSAIPRNDFLRSRAWKGNEEMG